jgi:DNA mismatch repair protein MutL
MQWDCPQITAIRYYNIPGFNNTCFSMSKIRILPEHLANRIAAGEVVERPASVVKELLENSLDAGADCVEIEVEGGGTRLIRIIDNGEGMDADDILLCLERHGTSKIKDDHDLGAISTLGFRGEALPSIGSVSKMVIISRPEESELGSRVVTDFGRLVTVQETGCRRGTVMEIRNLFGNTPARRKFLRTVRTELGHIEEVVKNYALAAPAVTFIVRIDNKETMHLAGGNPLERRLGTIMHFDGAFMEVGTPARAQAERFVHGLLVPPEAAVSAAAVLRLFVNGRAIKDRMMAHAVAEGLRGFLMKDRNPAGFLHLHLPACEVDVNVHPAKNEVRFRNTRDIHEMISQAVQTAIQDLQGSMRTGIFPLPPKRQAPILDQQRPEFTPPVSMFNRAKASPRHQLPSYQQRTEYKTFDSVEESPFPALSQQIRTEEPPSSFDRDETIQPDSATTDQGEHSGQGHGIQVIGQFRNLYILCRSGDSLVVIDQHAAHERLLFEKLRNQFLQGKVASQHLLFPVTVELSLFQSRLVEKNSDEIERLGFTIRAFGGNTHIISAVPALAGQCDPGALFMDTLERFGSENGKNRAAGRLDDILSDMACKAAVRAGDRLQPAEIDALLNRMAKADLFSHCPHGRPVMKIFQADEIKKWFHRP